MVARHSTPVLTFQPMQDTKNLIVAEHARRLAVGVYRLTADFPVQERFSLAQQMRRAAVSVGSNIAEGCGRNGNRELLNHLYIAFASSSEPQISISARIRIARRYMPSYNASSEC
jgi:four helix bundle protein